MSGPVLQVDLDAIEHNARCLVGFCRDRGISVTGVTKVTCGMPQAARALLKGGVSSLGESRLENIHRMTASGINAPFWLLRIPAPSAVDEIVRSVDISLNSEIKVIRALSAAAERQERVHQIILMVDLGDLREGFLPEDLLAAAGEVRELRGLRLRGLGTNLTCYGGVLPTAKNMQALVDHKKRVEDAFGLELDLLSGGNSSSLDLLRRGKMPREINHLRLGESLMLGKETAGPSLWPGARPDAFILKAEIIEIKEKPSVPLGERNLDAFGEKPHFEDRGTILRGILNIGREDSTIDGLTPQDSSLRILGASSDHLLLDVSARRGELNLGEELGFLLDYGALLAAMTSAYVKKEPLCSGEPAPREIRRILLGGSAMESPLPGGEASLGEGLAERLGNLPSSPLVLRSLSEDTSRDASDSPPFPLLCGEAEEMLGFWEEFPSGGRCAGLLWLTPRVNLSLLGSPLHQGTRPLFPLENHVILGLEEADSPTRKILGDLRIRVYTMEDIDLRGLGPVMREAMAYASAGVQGFFLRYNPALMDGGREGLTRRENYLAMELIARSRLLWGLELSEVFPWKEQISLEILLRSTAAALGRKILG